MTTATPLSHNPPYTAIIYIPHETGVAGVVRLNSGIIMALKSPVSADQIRKPTSTLSWEAPNGTVIDFGKISRIEEKRVDEKNPGIEGVSIYAEEKGRGVTIVLPIDLLTIARAIDDVNKDGITIVAHSGRNGNSPATITLAHLPVNIVRPNFRADAKHE